MIEHSEKEIIIISPWFDFQGHIKETLVSRIDAGVKITVITRKSDTPQHKGAISYLEKCGVTIYYDDVLHAKLLLSDREFAVLGSANLQERAMQKNHEIALATDECELIVQIMDFISYLEDVLKVKIFKQANEKFDNPVSKILKKFFKKKVSVTDVENKCPNCVGKLVIRESSYGKFYGCSNYPTCRYSENINEK